MLSNLRINMNWPMNKVLTHFKAEKAAKFLTSKTLKGLPNTRAIEKHKTFFTLSPKQKKNTDTFSLKLPQCFRLKSVYVFVSQEFPW